MNEEGYSKLKQIVKANVRADLSENKDLISVSFAAIIQTLKTDTQMVKLIQNISSTNDSEQYKDNNNNITQYIEFNKDSILDLSEKSFENLVDVLTNNAIDPSAASSNTTLSLPSYSSLAFLGLSNQSIYIYKYIE